MLYWRKRRKTYIELTLITCKVENVGGSIHNELWVPAEELETFNTYIIGKIRITKMYFGVRFQYPENENLKSLIQNHETTHKTI